MKVVGLALAGVSFAAAAIFSGCAASANSDGESELKEQAVAAALGAKCDLAAVKGGELHIYTWCDYIAPDVIRGFEEGLGCTVVVDTFDLKEGM